MIVHLDELDLIFHVDSTIEAILRPDAGTNRTPHFKVWDGYLSVLETDCPSVMRMPHFTAEIVVDVQYEAPFPFVSRQLGYSLVINCNPHPGVDLSAPEMGNIWHPILEPGAEVDWRINVPRRVAVQLTAPLTSVKVANGFHEIQVADVRYGALLDEIMPKQGVYFVPEGLNLRPGSWMILGFNGGRYGPRFDYVAHCEPT